MSDQNFSLKELANVGTRSQLRADSAKTTLMESGDNQALGARGSGRRRFPIPLIKGVGAARTMHVCACFLPIFFIISFHLARPPTRPRSATVCARLFYNSLPFFIGRPIFRGRAATDRRAVGTRRLFHARTRIGANRVL